MAEAASPESRTEGAQRPKRPAGTTSAEDGEAPSRRGGGNAARSRGRSRGESRGDSARSAPPEKSSGGSSGIRAAGAAREGLRQIVELTGKEPEGVTAVRRTDDGWAVGVEVVEDRRIPSASDILAVYEAELDADGDLTSYRRLRRYARGRGGDDEAS